MSSSTRKSQSKVTITKEHPRSHKPPVIVTAHLEDIPLIASHSYIQDARNRWYIHSIEVKQLCEEHVNIFNAIKPHIVNSVNWLKSLRK